MRINLQQSESLTAVLAVAATATNPSAHVEWEHQSTENTDRVTLTDDTAVTLLNAAEPEGRTVTGFTIRNADTAAATVTIAHLIGSTSNTLLVVTLQVGYTLDVGESGAVVLDTSGQVTYATSLALGNAAAFTNTVTTTDGVASGTARRVGGGAYRSIAASTAITGATETEANFDETYSLPADSLKVGTRVRIRAQGIHTATTGAETHTILLKLGSDTLASKASIDPADDDIFYFDFEFVCRTAGATGTIVGCGLLGAGVPGTANPELVHLASTTVDTTGALVIAAAIDRQAAATDADSARLDFLVVDVVG